MPVAVDDGVMHRMFRQPRSHQPAGPQAHRRAATAHQPKRPRRPQQPRQQRTSRKGRNGPPLALPHLLDQISERWWRARPRSRVAIGIFAVLGLLAAGLAHTASSPDGPPVALWVTTREVAVGDTLTANDLETRSWPETLVPETALLADSPADAPTGVVTAPLPQGATVTAGHLGEQVLEQLIGDGRVGVAVPTEQLPTVETGTRLDVVGVAGDGTGTVIATDAQVVLADGDTTWLAVDEPDAVAVSASVATSTMVAVVVADR